MLNIRQPKHLARAIGFSEPELRDISENGDSFCEQLVLLDPAKPEKRRKVFNVNGKLRTAQERLLRLVLAAKLTPSPFSHGGVRGRSIKTNATEHSNSVFVFTADISNFYPTIGYTRVYRLFHEQFGCTPDVARICTQLCTHRHHLALGLITSPFLADQTLIPVDRRIGAACASVNLTFSRFVDDIAISGKFDLQQSGFGAVVSQILTEHGFTIHPQKTEFGRLSDGIPITGITRRKDHPDVKREFVTELDRQWNDAMNLCRDGEFTGPYYTRAQILGRVHFVSWINPGRKQPLLRKLNAIKWHSVESHARARGLVFSRKSLIRE